MEFCFPSFAEHEILVDFQSDGSYVMSMKGEEPVEVSGQLNYHGNRTKLSVNIDGTQTTDNVVFNGDTVHLFSTVKIF